MPRALYRDTVMVKGPAGAIPLAGAAVEFRDPTTGQPIGFPLYPDGTSTTPLTLPYVTGGLGELEVWADQPHRVQVTVTMGGLTQAQETADLEYPPEYTATTDDVAAAIAAHEAAADPHLQYLQETEAALTYLPLTGGTVTGTLTVTGRITSNQDFSATGAAAGYVLEDRNLGQPASWTMYATDNTLRWYAGGDRMSLTNAGALSVVGAATVGGDVSAPGLFASGGGYWFGTRMGAAANRLEFLYGAAGAATTPLAYLFSDGSLYTGITPKLVGVSPDASNTLEWRANGFYATGGGGITQADADVRYVNTAGDTMTAPLNVQHDGFSTTIAAGGSGIGRYLVIDTTGWGAIGGGAVYIDGPSSSYRMLVWRSSTAPTGDRWRMGVLQGAESGSNAGADFDLHRYDDAGAALGSALLINRATGAATFGGNLFANGQIISQGTAAALVFSGRDSGNGFLWYANGGTAYLFNNTNGAQPLSVNATGNAVFSGEVTATSYLRTNQWVILDGADPVRVHSTNAPLRLNTSVGDLIFERSGGRVGGFRAADNWLDVEVGLEVANKAVAVSPDAGNALVWNANGFFVPAGGGGGLDVATGDARYVNTAGDAMTGDLSITNPSGTGGLYLNGSPASGPRIGLRTNGLDRWQMFFFGSESGSNAGSDFFLFRYDDAGNQLSGGAPYGAAFHVARATGDATFGGHLIGTGKVEAAGSQGVLSVRSRDGGPGWGLYSPTDRSLRVLDWTFGDRLTINNAGAATFIGSVTVASPGYLKADTVRITDPRGGVGTANTYEWFYSIAADTLAIRFGSDAGGYTDTGISFGFGGGVGATTLHGTTAVHSAYRLVDASPDAGNVIQFRANGFYSAGGAGAYLPLTGGTLTGDLSLSNGSGSGSFIVSGAPGAGSGVQWKNQNNSLTRWSLIQTGTESGSNAGMDLYLQRYNDAGTWLGNPLIIERATGAATFGGAVGAPSLTVASKPVAVSPDASNALEWRSNGFYTAGGGAGAYVDEAGDTMTGLLNLQGASTTANVLQAKIAADTQPRFRGNAAGLLEWGPGGTTAPTISLGRASTGAPGLGMTGDFKPGATLTYDLGDTALYWGAAYVNNLRAPDTGTLRFGTGSAGLIGTTGRIQFKNAMTIAWRNAGGSADLTLQADASDRLAYSGASIRVGTNPAGAGALQLPNNQAIAWRNAANTADLTLTVNASNALVSTAPVTTPAWMTTPSLYLDGAAGTARGAILSTSTARRWTFETDTAVESGSNAGSNLRIVRYDDAAAVLGDALTITRATGTVTLIPGAGQNALLWSGTGVLSSNGTNAVVGTVGGAGDLWLNPAGGNVTPAVDGFINVGKSGMRFAAFWAVAGTINTSSITHKDPAGDLDPTVALAAVLRTPARRFKYKGTDRVQSGYYLEEADPLFTIGPNAASATNDTGILLAAIQALAAELAAVKARLPA